MAPSRIERILGQLATSVDGRGRTSLRYCESSRDIVGVSGAGVMLMSGDLPAGSLCTTDDVSALIEQLQYTLGEGPCVDAYQLDQVVLEPDLARPGSPRWLAFTPSALDAGARAVFGFPLRVGAVRLGALNLYRDEAGPLEDEQHADALVLADLIAQWVLDVQGRASAGALAGELETTAELYAVVHNAAGAVSVQLGISVTEATIRLRAFAFTNGRPVQDVAQDVVDRKLRFR
ncbi:MAG: GAF domain-containing protein [Acidimicrobiales bacterium]